MLTTSEILLKIGKGVEMGYSRKIQTGGGVEDMEFPEVSKK